MSQPPLRLILDRVTKRFPQVLANDQVSMDVRAGEIHALLGENGAGKTTLMEITYGLHRADGGRILVDGSERDFRSPKDAMDHGLGMVHQNFTLVPVLTVAENVALELGARNPLLRLRPLADKIEHLSGLYGIPVDPWARVDALSMGELQRVEIVKALVREAQILILDEPTSLLTPQEAEQLFRVMRDLAGEGRSIIFISHKLDEVMNVSDRITVLRQGRVQATLEAADADERQLASLMVGDKALAALILSGEDDDRPDVDERRADREALVRVSSISVVDARRQVLDNFSVAVHAGEILGVAGVEGNGQRELAEALVGLRRPTKGEIAICGQEIRGLSHAAVMDLGVGFIPEDRQGSGIVMSFSVEENLILRTGARRHLTKWGFLKRRAIRRVANELIEEYDMDGGTRTPVHQLSGGNQQKVVLARELQGNPKVIIAAQPTRGLDISATSYVHRILRRHRHRGAAIVFISTNLDEILQLSDRIIVLFNGRMAGLVEGDQADRHEIGLMMAGSSTRNGESDATRRAGGERV